MVLGPGRRVEEQRQKRDRKKERKKRGTGCRRGRNREMKNVRFDQLKLLYVLKPLVAG